MKRPISLLLCAALMAGVLPARASADVNIERRSAENPMIEIFKSTIYGALTGVVVGGVIVLAAKGDSDTNQDIMRWSVVAGTVVGLGAGIYFTAKRPQPSALLELKDGSLGLHPAALQLGPDGGMSVRLLGVRF